MEELELNSFFFPPLFVERGRERESSHSILCRSLNLTCAQMEARKYGYPYFQLMWTKGVQGEKYN